VSELNRSIPEAIPAKSARGGSRSVKLAGTGEARGRAVGHPWPSTQPPRATRSGQQPASDEWGSPLPRVPRGYRARRLGGPVTGYAGDHGHTQSGGETKETRQTQTPQKASENPQDQARAGEGRAYLAARVALSLGSLHREALPDSRIGGLTLRATARGPRSAQPSVDWKTVWNRTAIPTIQLDQWLVASSGHP
jgi:hypothetical protein